MLIMISGTVTLRVGDKIFDAHPGHLVFFPPGSEHAEISVGKKGCVYYELFAPARRPATWMDQAQRAQVLTGPNAFRTEGAADVGFRKAHPYPSYVVRSAMNGGFDVPDVNEHSLPHARFIAAFGCFAGLRPLQSRPWRVRAASEVSAR